MTHRFDIKAIAIRTENIGRADVVQRALVSLLSVVIILGTWVSRGNAMG